LYFQHFYLQQSDKEPAQQVLKEELKEMHHSDLYFEFILNELLGKK